MQINELGKENVNLSLVCHMKTSATIYLHFQPNMKKFPRWEDMEKNQLPTSLKGEWDSIWKHSSKLILCWWEEAREWKCSRLPRVQRQKRTATPSPHHVRGAWLKVKLQRRAASHARPYPRTHAPYKVTGPSECQLLISTPRVEASSKKTK